MGAGPKRVLIVHSYEREFGPFNVISSTFRTELVHESPLPLEFHEASLEERHEPSEADKPLVEYLRAVFEGRVPDVIVTFAEPASLFLARHRAELFPDTPLVAVVNERLLPAAAAATNTIVVPVEINLPLLLENVLEVLPGTTNVAMILGTSPFERYWTVQCQREFAPFTNRVGISYLNDLSLDQIRERVAHLPQGSAVLYGTLMVDGAGVPYEQERALRSVREAAHAPVFGVLEHHLGNGIVGGRLVSMETLGREAARACLKVLQSEQPGKIGATGPGKPVYDWRELQRWGISEARLPLGSEVRYRTPGFWEQYKWQFIGIQSVVLAESAFIMVLVRNRRRLRRAQSELRESSERMKLAAHAAELGMWVWDIRNQRVWASEECKVLFGYSPEAEVTFEQFRARIHPEDCARRDKAIEQALAEIGLYDVQYRLLLPDGAIRWLASTGRVERDVQGKPSRLLGVAIDITERRDTEEAAREVSGRLITAQEDERRRLARDLHDDLNQRLALLSVELELMGQETVEALGERRARFEDMAARVKDLSSYVHKLSYALHPAKLDQLGLVAAARSYCRELSQQSGVGIDFLAENVTRELTPGVELCVYRVLQEALQNVVRHSGAAEARVNLRQLDGQIQLSVSEAGKGFDPQQARSHGGLGMLSMRERVRLVHGALRVESEPGCGTKIELRVPLAGQTAP